MFFICPIRIFHKLFKVFHITFYSHNKFSLPIEYVPAHHLIHGFGLIIVHLSPQFLLVFWSQSQSSHVTSITALHSKSVVLWSTWHKLLVFFSGQQQQTPRSSQRIALAQDGGASFSMHSVPDWSTTEMVVVVVVLVLVLEVVDVDVFVAGW